MYKLSLTLLMAFSIVANAGPNASATLFINFGTDTSKIDSVTYHIPSDTFSASIQVNKVVSLYDFQLLVSYDTAALEFISGTKELAATKNILETQKGVLSFFTCNYSRTDSTKISVAASVQGSDGKVCPNGSGFLAFLKFRKKTADTTAITIQKPQLETIDEIMDTTMITVRGTIFPGSSAVTRRNIVQPHFSVQKTGEIVTIFTAENTPQSIQLFTINGRCLTKIASTSRKTSFSLPSIIGNVPCIVRVRSGDNHFSSFMINN